jgi:hypothetical protein
MTVQSATVQQVPSGMHEFDAEQACWPAGQAHEPPGPEQVWPVTVQSALVQQAALAMQALFAEQTFWLAAQPQEPPGPEQV